MAPIDCSAIRTPRLFLGLAIALLAIRAVVTGALAFSPVVIPGSHTSSWQDASQQYWLPQQISKPVIYEFSANWSDPCKQMDLNALSNRQVRELIDRNFQPIRVVDVAREQGKNPQWITDLQKRYRVFALPTLIVVDAKGEATATLIGNCNSLSVYRFLTRAVHASASPIAPKG